MAQNSPRIEGNDRPSEKPFESEAASSRVRHRDQRLLLDTAESLIGAKNLPDLFKELAPRILSLTGSDFLKFSLHDPQQSCMITHSWEPNQDGGQLDAFPVNECVSGWVWMRQEAITIPRVETEK